MRLWAISDLHVEEAANREAVRQLGAFGEDWLLIAGDVAQSGRDLKWTLTELGARFAKLFWTPGNHELWARPNDPDGHGVDRYHRLVHIARACGCVTPEDPYVVWPGASRRLLIAPVFVLYDYSFRPPSVPLERALDWAAEHNILCMDERLLDTRPFANVIAWCHQRVTETQSRLQRAIAAHDGDTILLSHFPLRFRDVHLPRIPRFSLWCGTRKTEDWAVRFRARACVFGHLHVRRTTVEDGCRFEEVSLGYPTQWAQDRGLQAYLRRLEVLADSGEAANAVPG